MKCQNCGINNANVSYTRIINGDKMELHLCSECAKKMNIEVNFNFGLDNIFSSFFHDFERVRSLAMPEFSELNVLERGLNDWMNCDFLGETSFFENDSPFRTRTDELDNVLENIQKKHKRALKDKKIEPKENGTENDKKDNRIKIEDKKKNEIEQLKAKIQEYIKTEEYEKAAVLRDKIKELEK